MIRIQGWGGAVKGGGNSTSEHARDQIVVGKQLARRPEAGGELRPVERRPKGAHLSHVATRCYLAGGWMTTLCRGRY